MDMTEFITPMVGNIMQSRGNAAALAHQLSAYFDENSLQKAKENLEELKSRMSCY